jgi:long-chain acyl-CoA synthetase
VPRTARAAAGEIGEVCVRGEVVMAGYWQQPEATAATLRDGWLWTGDIGRLDADGFLTLLDRSKDLVISGGNNVYPREVEEVLLQHPAVAEVSVIGRPDPEWGESLVAYVVARSPVGRGAGRPLPGAHRALQAAQGLPLRRRLPKNNYGKVLKTELTSSRSTWT